MAIGIDPECRLLTVWEIVCCLCAPKDTQTADGAFDKPAGPTVEWAEGDLVSGPDSRRPLRVPTCASSPVDARKELGRKRLQAVSSKPTQTDSPTKK